MDDQFALTGSGIMLGTILAVIQELANVNGVSRDEMLAQVVDVSAGHSTGNVLRRRMAATKRNEERRYGESQSDAGAVLMLVMLGFRYGPSGVLESPDGFSHSMGLLATKLAGVEVDA